MSSGPSDYVDSDDDGPYMRGGVTTDEDYMSGATTEEEGGDLFDEAMDPFALLEGMEHTDRAFELLRRRHRRQSSRQAQRGEAEEEEEEEEDGEEEEDDEDEDEDEEMPEEGAKATARTAGATTGAGPSGTTAPDAARPPSAGGAGGVVEDEWNENLAERFGLAPVMSRRKQRNREKWRRRAAKKGTRRRDMPEEAARKLGEANLLYATQKYQDATVLLMDVVRLAPTFPDAYSLLGLLYEAMGNHRKALNFFMVAAHITPRDVEQWKRLAHLSREQGLTRQAIYCMTQVIKRERDDVEWRFERAELYAELGDVRKALEGFEQFRAARPDNAEVVKHLARLYYRAGQLDKAAEVLRAFINEVPEGIDLTHVNLLAELLCAPEVAEWAEVLTLLERTANELLPEGEEMPPELAAKGAVAKAQLGDVDAARDMLQPLLAQPVETFQDVYVLIADSMEEMGHPELAEPFIESLAFNPSTGAPWNWARLAECRRRSGGAPAAAEAWQRVVDSISPDNPGHLEALLSLANTLKETGDDAAAAAALGGLDVTVMPRDISMEEEDVVASQDELLHRAGVLKSCGRPDLLVDLALPSLEATLSMLAVDRFAAPDGRRGRGRGGGRGRTRAAPLLRDDFLFKGYMADQRPRRKKAAAAAAQEADGVAGGSGSGGVNGTAGTSGTADGTAGGTTAIPTSAADLTAQIRGITFAAPILPSLLRDDLPFQLMVDTASGLLAAHRVDEARRLTQSAVDVLSKRQANRRRRDTMRLLLAESCLAMGDLNAALASIKTPSGRWTTSPVVWNAFARLQLATGGVRQTAKFIAPLRQKNPGSLPLALMNGHGLLNNNMYGAALGEYFQAYRLAPQEPLVLLCIAAALVNQAASRYVPDRHAAVLQAFAFLQEYGRQRGDAVEASYNAGRAAQHLSLNFLAVPLYRKALDIAAKEEVERGMSLMDVDGGAGAGAGAGVGAVKDPCSVAPEAAFNLSLILQNSGATSLARDLMKKHLTF